MPNHLGTHAVVPELQAVRRCNADPQGCVMPNPENRNGCVSISRLATQTLTGHCSNNPDRDARAFRPCVTRHLSAGQCYLAVKISVTSLRTAARSVQSVGGFVVVWLSLIQRRCINLRPAGEQRGKLISTAPPSPGIRFLEVVPTLTPPMRCFALHCADRKLRSSECLVSLTEECRDCCWREKQQANSPRPQQLNQMQRFPIRRQLQ
ncbi:hypothetical protein B0T16DRAFT_153042 [Cercophora newfieldiana]|uniref:Uncharacterized protein n=1 Tax=Cercophora newfieldiana TaxID=92897 RepID=A0AA40CP48_9PEZI|nr:hypothetical protein B0T16DRAFT_153042 [Cercophora newfieldiana]